MNRAEQAIRDGKVVEAYTLGKKTLDQLGPMFSISPEGARQILLRHNVKMRPPSTEVKVRKNAQSARDALILARCAKGATLRELGKEFNLTAEGIRQILRKNSVPRRTLPKAGVVLSTITVERRKGGEFMNRYGVDRKTFYLLTRNFPKLHVRYASHKANAQRRGIKWDLTLPEYAWLLDLHTKQPLIDRLGQGKEALTIVRRDPRQGFTVPNTVVVRHKDIRVMQGW